MPEETSNAVTSEQSWGDYISEQLSQAEVVDEQPETDSETETTDEAQTDDQGTEETTEEESDVEETDAADEDNEDDADETPALTDDTEIEMGEGRQPIKLSELKSGYMRQSDYTKKTQALADERKEFEAESAQLQPARDFQQFIESNPYLFQQIKSAVDQWNETGVLPLEEALQDAEYGRYINHLMAENNRIQKEYDDLQKELDRINGEYQESKFDSDFRGFVSELKTEYEELITPEYEQDLQKQAKDEGLSFDVLKKIVKGDLADKKIELDKTKAAQKQEESKKQTKKQEAKTVQKLREKKMPPQPGKTAQQPTKEEVDTSNMSWEELFRSVGQG